jgi:hypothetical protein
VTFIGREGGRGAVVPASGSPVAGSKMRRGVL